MKVQRNVLAIVLMLFSLFGLFGMVLGDMGISNKAGADMLAGLKLYFWAFGALLLMVSIGMMQVDRDEVRDETVTTIEVAKK
jgi:hypothetical protein